MTLFSKARQPACRRRRLHLCVGASDNITRALFRIRDICTAGISPVQRIALGPIHGKERKERKNKKRRPQTDHTVFRVYYLQSLSCEFRTHNDGQHK